MPPDSPTPDQPGESSPRPRRIVVLTGGGSRRLGRDKLAENLGARTVLGALVDGLHSVAPDAQVVLVGPPERAALGVLVVQEDPPGGGPVAGLAAGLTVVPTSGATAEPTPAPTSGPAPTLSSDDNELVAVLAGDQPFAATALALLAAALNTPSGAACDLDGAIGVDPDGRDQPLLAVYRMGALRQALRDMAAEAGLAGGRVRDLIARLRLTRVPLPPTAALDVDTAQDLERARALVRREADARRP